MKTIVATLACVSCVFLSYARAVEIETPVGGNLRVKHARWHRERG
jgi:hypothetical protein